jgi:hypothetical protein
MYTGAKMMVHVLFLTNKLKWNLMVLIHRSNIAQVEMSFKGYVPPKLKSSLQKVYGRHRELVDSHKISIPQLTFDLFL